MRFATLILFWALGVGAEEPLPIPFLSQRPQVDGRLDAGLDRLPVRPLEGPGPQAAARFAYGPDFLYVHLRSPQDALRCRDRAYQNGDGLLLVLAVPTADGSPTERFQVLGFSPQPRGARTWQHAFTWYRDRDLAMVPLERGEFAAAHQDGVLELEALVPWSELAPVHPWLSGPLGINLAFVRAEEGASARTLHLLVPDGRLMSEQSPRAYRPVRFEVPHPGAGRWVAGPEQGCLAAGEPLRMRLAGFSEALDLQVVLRDGEGATLSRRTLRAVPSTAPQTVDLGLPLPPPGGITVAVEGAGVRWTWGVTVLQPGGLDALRAELAAREGTLAPGAAATLAFRLQDAEARLARRRPEDSASGARRAIEALERDLHAAALGKDPFQDSAGLQRKAYRSALDRTLQPYSLRIPEGIQAGKRYPLLMFLHGSGQDDQGSLARPRAPEGWFELAPKGRGTSNCFSAEQAQVDLREALEAVLREHPVDPSRIVLAGFSMGGYGVYRTAWERPGLFRGLAIFSGVPDLATRWLGPGHPDFSDPATHGAFKGSRLFVFHGTADLNCPFQKTESLVQALRRAGAEVAFVTEEGKGHEAPSDATAVRFRTWLEEVVR